MIEIHNVISVTITTSGGSELPEYRITFGLASDDMIDENWNCSDDESEHLDEVQRDSYNSKYGVMYASIDSVLFYKNGGRTIGIEG